MTSAVESLHLLYPDCYATDVRTTAWEIWEHNPRITPINVDEPGVVSMTCEYPAIHRSNSQPKHMIEAFCEYLGERLNVPLPCLVNRPLLYLSEDEKGWVNQVRETFSGGKDITYWLINAGSKADMPAKQYPIESYQEIVRLTRGKIQWVQIGASEHFHPALEGVLDLRGKTDTRQLIRLAYHARGGLGGITFLMHIMAAHRKPYVCMAGGREPLQWISYPLQHTFHSLGALPCCSTNSCWKSHVMPHDSKSVCERPVYGGAKPVGQCMAAIKPTEVVTTLERLCASC